MPRNSRLSKSKGSKKINSSKSSKKGASLKKKNKSVEKKHHTLNESDNPDEMNLTDLQFVARSLGIPFGGLNKSELLRKIKRYK